MSGSDGGGGTQAVAGPRSPMGSDGGDQERVPRFLKAIAPGASKGWPEQGRAE